MPLPPENNEGCRGIWRTTTLALPRDESVLDSAQKVRGDLPFACKGGVCGTCRARVTDGMRFDVAPVPSGAGATSAVEAGVAA